MEFENLSPEEREKAVERKMYEDAGIPYPGDAADPNKGDEGDPGAAGDPNKPVEQPDPSLNNNNQPIDEEAVALAAINKRRGTNYATLEEALAAIHPAPAPAPETPEQIAEREKEEQRKREREKLTFALNNNLFTTEEYNSYQVDKAKSPREIALEEFLQKQEAKGVAREDAELDFERKFPEDDEDVADALQAKADRILKAKYPQMRGLDRKYEAHVSEQETTRTRAQERTQFVQSFKQDVDAVVGGLKQRIIKVRTGEGDATVDIPFDFKPQVLEQVRNEFSQELAADRFAGNYSREVLESAINYRLQELTQDEAIGFAARKYGTMLVDQKKIGRKSMSPDEPLIEGGAGERDEFMYQALRDYIPQEGK